MSIKKILVSQPTPSADKKSPFSLLTEKYSVAVDFQQFIAVEGVGLQEFISQRVSILDHNAVIFTSRSLIDNFFRLVASSRLTIPDTMKYFCISEAVALYLQKYIVYRKRKVFFATGSVTSLMDMILKHNSHKFLLPLSEPYKPELPMAMSCAVLNYSTVILSHTVSRDLSGVCPSDYDMVALYSPQEVKNFAEVFVGEGYSGRLALFGEATVKAALALGLRVDLMAPTQQCPSMTAAISAYCKAESEGADLSEFRVESLGDETQNELLKMAVKRKCRTKKVEPVIKSKSSSKSATPLSSAAAKKTLEATKSGGVTKRATVSAKKTKA